jgi:DNA ligase (NAD+)
MIAGIEAKRSSPLARFLYSFGIRHVGETATKALAKRYGTLDSFMEATDGLRAVRRSRIEGAVANGDWGGNKKVQYDRTRFELELAKELAMTMQVDGMGPELVSSLLDFMDDEHNVRMIRDMADQMTLLSPEKASSDSPVAGKTIVFTGSLERMDRKAAEAHAESLGAKTSGSVSAKTSILVHGPGAGSKLAKAQSLGVACMTEAEWFEMVG